MTQKAKLTLDLLEKELQLISKEEQERTKGGMGVVTSGSGTTEDPYIISVQLLHLFGQKVKSKDLTLCICRKLESSMTESLKSWL